MGRRTLEEKKGCSSCLRYLIIIISFLYLLIAMVLIGLFVWIILDQIWLIKGLLGTDLVLVSAIQIIVAAVLLLIFSCFGMVAVTKEKLSLIITYIIVILIVLLLFASSAICISIFKIWLTEPVKLYMEVQLKNVYGYNLDNPWNKQVTDSWNIAQQKWRCCSAADKSWANYQESRWYEIQNLGPAFIPESCCEKDKNEKFINKEKCQFIQPPKIGDDNPGQDAPRYFRGCYETAKDFLLYNEVSWFSAIFWISIGGILLMLFLLLFTSMMACQVNRQKNRAVLKEQELHYMTKTDNSYNQYLINNRINAAKNPSNNNSPSSQYLYSMA